MDKLDEIQENQEVCKSSNHEDEIVVNCKICSASYVTKYWDDELEWYIEINTQNLCEACKKQVNISK